MGARIEIKDVTNRFGAQVVHDKVNMTLEDNEILGLVGGSGSGKSVLLRTMLGLNKPQEGKVLIDGQDIYALSTEEMLDIQKKWGVLFQNGALFSGMSVLDNIALPMREHTKLSPGEIDNLASLKLQMVGLNTETAAKQPSELSGGMVTRAGMARAMALDPGILFLDEPTGALDPVAANALDELMKSLQDILKLSIMVITHDLNTLLNVCDRIAMIVDKKVEIGTLEDMRKSDNPKIKEYFDGPRMQALISNQKKGSA